MKKFLEKIKKWYVYHKKFPILFSRDSKYYYVDSDVGWEVKHWLSVEKLPASYEKEHDPNVWKGGITIRKKSGEVYCREALPWVFWEVKSGERKWIKGSDDLVIDYLCFPK